MEPTVVSETVPMSLAISVSPRGTAPITEPRAAPWRTPLAMIMVAGLRSAGGVRLRSTVTTSSSPATPSTTTTRPISWPTGKGFINPYSLYYGLKVVPGASHPPLWTLVLALAAVLGIKTFFGQLLYSAAIGAVSVALVGMAGREVAGPRAGLIAAGITAVYPVFLIDDGSLLAETLVVPLTALVVWAFYRLWHRPSLARAALLGALCALCALTRSELVLLVGFLAVPAGLLLRGRSWRTRLGLSAASLIAALCIFAPWWAYTLPRFSHPEFLSDQLGVTLASANCNQTYHGRLLGYWSFTCVDAPTKPGAGRVGGRQGPSVERHPLRGAPPRSGPGRRGGTLRARLRCLRAVAGDRPRMGSIGRPRLPATIGLFSYYLIAVTAVGGAVVLRRRHVPLFPVGDHPRRGGPRGRGHLRPDPLPHPARRRPRDPGRGGPRPPPHPAVQGPGQTRHQVTRCAPPLGQRRDGVDCRARRRPLLAEFEATTRRSRSSPNGSAAFQRRSPSPRRSTTRAPGRDRRHLGRAGRRRSTPSDSFWSRPKRP